MSDDILSRARLLAKAANEVADQMSSQVDEYKAIINARKADEAKNMEIENEKRKNEEKSRNISLSDVGNQKFVRGAAICGSALVTTYEDIRPFAPRGSIIFIDGIQCKLKMNGEWSANRIELDSDYSGSTNLDANIGATITADIVKKRSPKKNKAVPIASSDISSAVADLDLGNITSRGTTKHQSTDRAKKPKKVKPPSQSSSITDSLSEYSKVLLSDRSSYPVVHNPNVSVHIDDTDRVDSSETSRSLLKPPLHHLSNFTNSSSIKSASSPSARSILSTSSKLSTQSKQSTTSNYTQSSKGITGSDIIAADQNLEPEQIRMLNEIDNITPEEQQRRRYEMNLRMADRGQQKAVERVEQRRQLESLKEENQSFQSYQDSYSQGGEVPSEEFLAEQRRLAFLRVAQKRQEEDRLIAERLKREEEEKLQYKKMMEEKAEKLRQLTAQRVAEYKLMKKEKERKKREATLAEEALKREREMECQSELYLKKLQQRMAETEARLLKQKKDFEERKYLEKVEIENKLSDLAAQRHRTKDIVTIPPPLEGDQDDKTNASSKEKSSLPKVSEKVKKKSKVVQVSPDQAQAQPIQVSVNTKPAHFLPGIRTSTSEQSNRLRNNSNLTKDSAVKGHDQPKIHRNYSADVHQTKIPIPRDNKPPLQRSVAATTTNDIDEEYLSDDSLQGNNKIINKSQQQHKESLHDYLPAVHHHHPSSDNSTIISALTTDTNLQSFTGEGGGGGGIDENKIKKKKRKVWKMEPIPIKPYVQIPINSG